jgi:RNA polymerase sigma-70 factor (ECF subfamily)
MSVETLELNVESPAENPAPTASPPLAELQPEFAAIYEAHNRQVFYLALRLLGDQAQAEDATHDVFIKAYRNLGRFRGEAEIRTWLYRITLNHCSNLRQSWHARNVHVQSDEAVFENASGSADSPLRVLEISELGQRIQKSLDTLPDEYRLLLLLVADEELSYDQIAELTQQSADAVRGKLHRARKAFGVAFKKTA